MTKFFQSAMLILALMGAGSLGHAGPEAQGGSSTLEKFFENMGFRDYSAEIAQTLKKDESQKTLTVIQKQTLHMNQERYESYNAARRLAIRILTALYANPSSEQIAKTIKLAASQMGLKPTPPPSTWPAAIEQMSEKTPADKDAKDKARADFIKDAILKDINDHTLKIVSDIVETLYGEQAVVLLNARLKNSNSVGSAGVSTEDKKMLGDLQQISADVKNLTEFLYLDGEMGDNLLGQTLALGLSKFEVDQNKLFHTENQALTQSLSRAAAAYGERLQDYVGNTIMFEDKKRGQVPITFHSGMIIAERAAIYPQESSELAWAARPGSLGNWLRAFKLDFLGDPVGMAVGFEDGGDKPQSLWKRIQYTIQQMPVFNRGLSHAGWAYVFKDPETGIQSVKAVDIYPGLVHGGIRIVKIKKFASRGINLRFATTRIDALQFRKWAREQIKRGMLSSTAWDGKQEFVDENGNPLPHPEVRDDWASSLTPDEVVRRFNNYTDDEAQEWFENEVIGPALARTFEFLTVDGVAFAEHFTDYKWRSYCSKLVALTIKMESGFDLQTYPDRFNLIARVADDVGFNFGNDLHQRIVAPGGLFWQRSGTFGPALSEYTEVINYPDDGNFKDRMNTQFAPRPPDFNSTTTAALTALKVLTTDQQIPYKFISDDDSGLLYRMDRALDANWDKASRSSQAGINRAGVNGASQGYLGGFRNLSQNVLRACPLLLENLDGVKR